jgi:hypothetical protein
MQIIYADKKIIKIGQYPSKADIENSDWNKYSKIIPQEYLSDIKKAIGLSSHGIGAGAFVYLRRVIEYLLNEAYEKARSKNEIDPDIYAQSRITEKIKLLEKFLPKILVENKLAYSILSKGVHELKEEECIKNFSLLSSTIELILEEMLNETQRKEREDIIRSGISNLHSRLNNNTK